ncbi:hypothetical protein Y032_0077g1106 [Ancylostoma ceylanicum]|nr:hypothetical protein Y032_0077g1106 [Ancylostoma ceylanicum]
MGQVNISINVLAGLSQLSFHPRPPRILLSADGNVTIVKPSSPLEMFFFVFRLLLVFALLGAVLAGDPCSECTPRRPNGCCRGPSGTCCWTRKKRDVESQEDVEPIDFKPLEE